MKLSVLVGSKDHWDECYGAGTSGRVRFCSLMIAEARKHKNVSSLKQL